MANCVEFPSLYHYFTVAFIPLLPRIQDPTVAVSAMKEQRSRSTVCRGLPNRSPGIFYFLRGLAVVVSFMVCGHLSSLGAEIANADSSSMTGSDHWAFQSLLASPVPTVSSQAWAQNEVDAFILAGMQEVGLSPVADADPYTWLRRVHFDLTGLPPSVEAIEAFVQQDNPKTREAVVDRLLASRAFGERWARHWLDLVGYADQIGTSNNVFAQHAWRYRDYVIDAFNQDKPFDKFVREQIAGDLLESETVEDRAAALTATGFLVLGDIEIVEADKAKLRVDIVDQQLNKVGKTFLAMTLECARCHAHKFDPISLRDYYAMAGFFHNTSSIYKTNRGVWSDVNLVDLPETGEQKAQRELETKVHEIQLNDWRHERQESQARRGELDKFLKGENLTEADQNKWVQERDERVRRIGRLNQLIEHAEFFYPDIPKAHGVHDVDTPTEMRITIRGNPRALGDKVPRGFLEVCQPGELPNIPASQSGRRELADWVVSNPLTARVIVNRVWQKLFGEGLVRSVDYFGLPGDQPSHPALLDFLALRLKEQGWSMKKLVRELTLTRTYQLSSQTSGERAGIDPDNRRLWRMNRTRLDAEALRDAMIYVSGNLKPSDGGPALPLEFVENVGGLNPADVNPPSFRFSKWRPEQQHERTIYLPVIRHAGQPGPAALRNVFDFPQPSQFTGQRTVTTVPTQALFLMNSPVVQQHAKALAERALRESESRKDRLSWLYLTLLNRPITSGELKEAEMFLEGGGSSGWEELCRAMLAGNEFLMRL